MNNIKNNIIKSNNIFPGVDRSWYIHAMEFYITVTMSDTELHTSASVDCITNVNFNLKVHCLRYIPLLETSKTCRTKQHMVKNT